MNTVYFFSAFLCYLCKEASGLHVILTSVHCLPSSSKGQQGREEPIVFTEINLQGNQVLDERPSASRQGWGGQKIVTLLLLTNTSAGNNGQLPKRRRRPTTHVSNTEQVEPLFLTWVFLWKTSSHCCQNHKFSINWHCWLLLGVFSRTNESFPFTDKQFSQSVMFSIQKYKEKNHTIYSSTFKADE